MREVIVCGNPLYHVMGMWLNFYSRWQDEVDHLRTDLTTKIHSDKLRDMVRESKADYLLLCEDDGIIFKKGIVDKYFKMLESGEFDVIGSQRFSCGQEIARIVTKKFGITYEGLGDHGPAFWPNFFFVKRDLLMQTDLDFFPHGWKKGEILLGEEMQADDTGDTMVHLSLQIHNLTNRILYVPQYHASPYDFEEFKNNLGVFDGICPWVHMGSLSGDFTTPHSELEFAELERRAMWNEMCGKDMTETINKYGLSKERIERRKLMYHGVLWT